MTPPTDAQVRALEGVWDHEVVLDRYGAVRFDGNEISGSALAACRRRDWVEVDRSQGAHGRYALTKDGRKALFVGTVVGT